VIQQLNVTPTHVELVFAPNPERLIAPLDQFYRMLPDLVGGSQEICGPDLSSATVTDAPVSSLQLGRLEPTGSEDIPPIPCSELGAL
jgi:hypothetical protein